MGAYIDRDELLELYANTDELDISNYDVKVAIIRQNILDMPTIDIVRCGECEYADEYNHCKYSAWWNGNADFCSHGIRRKENQ